MKQNYLERNYIKFRNKLFTYKEVVEALNKSYTEMVEDIKEANTLNNQYNIAILTATLLNAKPYGFGKKRLTEFFLLFFEQLNYLGNNPDDYELAKKTVSDLGLTFEMRKGKLHLTIK